MSYLTESLKIEILMMIGYGDRARTQCDVVRLFRETHPDLPPLNQGTISKIEAQLREMGHVRKVPSKRQAVVDDDTKLNLLLALEENPITPARQLARDTHWVGLNALKLLRCNLKDSPSTPQKRKNQPPCRNLNSQNFDGNFRDLHDEPRRIMSGKKLHPSTHEDILNKLCAFGCCPISSTHFQAPKETEVKNKFEYFPVVWFRYMDDIFAVFDTKAISLDNYVAKLNNRFPTIKFTCEMEHNEQLLFLDVLVIRNSENKLEFDCNSSMNNDNGSIPTSPLFALINKDRCSGSVNRGNKF
ncbi:hypothetical protein NQ318_001306 [Aromia moschata]|uniref:DUF4817 domain-containing protein n=1 Tax=Aromia moschata TaxID=1265417 RepID=A0AAV8ZF05_9CUCU|nr:hypothetical protein NQ318_001306 [Aromia moschata]